MAKVAPREFRRDEREGGGHRAGKDAAANHRTVIVGAVRVFVFAGVHVHAAEYSTAGRRETSCRTADMRAAHARPQSQLTWLSALHTMKKRAESGSFRRVRRRVRSGGKKSET